MSDIMSFSPLWGEWHIKDLIGKGTFGAVYRAEKTEYGNTYTSAVKHISIPHDNVNPESLIADGLVPDEKSVPLYYDALRNQMITEINFCYTLRGNTNIVSYEDHCIIPKDNGIGYDIFIRMEYLTALPKYMREHYFDENCVIQLGIDICAALEVLDKHQIIHRDIKPANIFVNAVGVYKLGDFGESKVLSGSNAGMTVRGTYTYMSPEISRGGQADIRSDIYSLGIVMYRLLNGNKAPFVPADQPTVDTAAVEAANVRRFRGDPLPKPPYCQNPTLADVILKACAFAPEQRWQKPKQFRKALESIQEAIKSGGQTAAAQPAPPPAAPTPSPDGGNKKKLVPLLREQEKTGAPPDRSSGGSDSGSGTHHSAVPSETVSGIRRIGCIKRTFAGTFRGAVRGHAFGNDLGTDFFGDTFSRLVIRAGDTFVCVLPSYRRTFCCFISGFTGTFRSVFGRVRAKYGFFAGTFRAGRNGQFPVTVHPAAEDDLRPERIFVHGRLDGDGRV